SSFYFFFDSCGDHRDLHSFPTRRSSDLVGLWRECGHADSLIRLVQLPAKKCSERTAEAHSGFSVAAGASVGPGPRRLSDSAKYRDRKSTRLNSSHVANSYSVFCLKKTKR